MRKSSRKHRNRTAAAGRFALTSIIVLIVGFIGPAFVLESYGQGAANLYVLGLIALATAAILRPRLTGPVTRSRGVALGILTLCAAIGINNSPSTQSSRAAQSDLIGPPPGEAWRAAEYQPTRCQAPGPAAKRLYAGRGGEVALRSGPGREYDPILVAPLRGEKGAREDVTIDRYTTLTEHCRQGAWSLVRIVAPAEGTQPHQGWIVTERLRKIQFEGGRRVFTVDDIFLDERVWPHQETVVAGINKAHREDDRCAEIDPGSAYIAPGRGTSGDPVFFVICGTGPQAFHHYFSKSEVARNPRG